MTIKVGDKLPDATFTVMTGEGPKPMSTSDIFGGKKSCVVRGSRGFYPNLLC